MDHRDAAIPPVPAAERPAQPQAAQPTVDPRVGVLEDEVRSLREALAVVQAELRALREDLGA